jgi:transcriptional regulator NrdR
MNCPKCGYYDSKVIDSRPADNKIRRRRECLKCDYRFTTYESVEATPIIVIKKDKSSQQFSKSKLLSGLLRACEKRSVPASRLEEAISEIETKLSDQGIHEIKSSEIGELVMEQLKDIDLVAYVRFASVYGEFDDIEQFKNIINSLK